MIGAVGHHLLLNAASHDIPRRQFGQLMLVQHEPIAGVIPQVRAFTANRFRDEERSPAGELQDGRVELAKLEIDHGRARPNRHRQAIRGRRRRVRCRCPKLTRATGRQHDRLGCQRDRLAVPKGDQRTSARAV